MALSAKINGVTYRCVDDYSIKEQGAAVSGTTINVLLGSNPVPLILHQVQLYIDSTLFFSGLVRSVGTPEYSTAYEANIFSLDVSSLESLFNMRLVTKNFYYYTYSNWTEVVQWLFDNYIDEENITLGAISTTSKTFDSKYSVTDKKLFDVLNEIADAIGNASWKVTADRKFYFLISTDFTEVTAPSKLSNVKLTENIGDLRTIQTIVGASSGIRASETNATLLATIAARTGGSGKIEIVENDSEIHSDAKAATEAAARLANYAETTKEVSCLCHDLSASTLFNLWPLSLTLNGVSIIGDFVVTERTISHHVGSSLNIAVQLKNNNYFARYGYSLKSVATIAKSSEVVISDQNSDDKLTPLEKKQWLIDWEAIAAEKSDYDSMGAAYGLTALVAAYDDAFQDLADYLNDGVTWVSGTPAFFDGDRVTQTEDIDGAALNALVSAYKNAKNELQNELRESAGRTLSITTSTITRNRAGALNPTTLTMYGKTSSGASYAGRFSIDISHDNGATWQLSYVSASDESSYVYTIPATMVVDTVTYYVKQVRIRLYASGGTDTLLRESLCTISLEASSSAMYWGPRTSDPTASMILGDFYFDSNLKASGGGVLRRYDETTTSPWPEFTSSMPGYRDAVMLALGDMGEWATAQDEVIAAASGIFQQIATADAFVANLFAQKITVPSNGSIAYYAGALNSRRYVSMHEDLLDFIKAPDTTPATDENIASRIGRLGINGPVLYDGDHYAQLETGFIDQGQIASLTAVSVSAVRVANDDIWAFYTDYSDSQKIKRIVYDHSTKTFGTATLIVDATCYDIQSIQLFDERIVLVYRKYNGTDYDIYYRIYDGSTWSDETLIVSNYASNGIACTLLENDHILLCSRKTSDAKLYTCEFDGTSWGSAVLAVDASSYNPTMGIDYENVVHLIYWLSSDGNMYEVRSDDHGATWSSAVLMSAGAFQGTMIRDISGNLRYIYALASGSYPAYQRIYSNLGVWSTAELLGITLASRSASVQANDGRIIFLYRDGSFVFKWAYLDRYARIGAGIVESGSNSNGSYAKFGDGTLLQWGKTTPSSSSTTLVGALYVTTRSVTFPMAFASAEYSYTSRVNSSSNGGYMIGQSNIYSTTGITDYVLALAAGTITVGLTWIAFGIWK